MKTEIQVATALSILKEYKKHIPQQQPVLTGMVYALRWILEPDDDVPLVDVIEPSEEDTNGS